MPSGDTYKLIVIVEQHMFKHKQFLFGLDHEQMNHLAQAVDHEHVGHLTDDRLNSS